MAAKRQHRMTVRVETVLKKHVQAKASELELSEAGYVRFLIQQDKVRR